MTYKLRGLGVLRFCILKLYDPYLEWFPLDYYVISIVETVSTKDWLQKVDLAFHVEVRGDRKFGHEGCIHCVWLPWMVILIIERVRCHVLLADRVWMGHVASIVGTLITTVMSSWFLYSLWWDWRRTHFKLWLVGTIVHHAAFDLLHLCHIRGGLHLWIQVVTTSHLGYLALIVVSWHALASLDLRQELMIPLESPEFLSTP